MKVKINNASDNKLPFYATEKSAGMDLYSNEDIIILKPMERRIVGTGISIELPDGYEAQVRPRSGMAAKQGVTVLNAPGTVDADYRGEIKVILINLSDKDAVILAGNRIAQLVVAKYEKVEWEEVDKLSETERGKGGIGSTGK